MSSGVDTLPLVDSARSIDTCNDPAVTLRMATPRKGTDEVLGGLADSFRMVCNAVTTAGAEGKPGGRATESHPPPDTPLMVWLVL